MQEQIASEERQLVEARARGGVASLRTFLRLSGPGWLQSAITLGGGSLASSLYLGVLTGFGLLWLQLVAMLLGLVMLAAIGYVTLSTGERPFRAINRHINPVLGWGWILAVLAANLVWSLPQFALGTAAIQQNLIPSLEGTGGTVLACLFILLVSTVVIWFYDSGTKGMRVFDWVLKGLVGLVVVSFFGVVVTLGLSQEGLAWGSILRGLVPDPALLTSPSAAFDTYLAGTGRFASWWSARIVSEQQDVMIAAAATAVGINMTFLLPYSMLKKGWGREFRGLAIFDLGTGLLIPFVLATGCVVIASASRFHASFDQALIEDVSVAAANDAYLENVDARLEQGFAGSDSYAEHSVRPALRESLSEEAFRTRVGDALRLLPAADLQLAAMLLKRDAFSLARALEPLTGNVVAQYVFGIGVLGMAISTVIILMLISGFTFCEMFGLEHTGWPHRLGCLAAGLVGFMGPFVWSGARVWLAMPTSAFGMALLPIAYWTFFLMMNSRSLMGAHLPRGRSRLLWNGSMLVAASVATFASLYTVNKNAGWKGNVALAAFLALALVVHLVRRGARHRTEHSDNSARS